MAFIEVKNVAIKGISACVPKEIVDNAQVYNEKWGGYDNFVVTTGIERHRISAPNICSSDLCAVAAKKLIEDLGWDKSEIDALIFVSQTPDFYNIPATSTHLQDRLGLSNNCYSLDIVMGCSGWVYAMSVITTLMQNGTIKKGLLLAGDTLSKVCSLADKSTYPLFGDAGTATALVYDETASPTRFAMYTDGSGYNAIIMDAGGYRNPVTPASFEVKNHGEGKDRCDLNIVMDGESVFVFGISKAPKAVKALCENFDIEKDDIDIYTFHQANFFMNEKIRGKLKLELEKVPYCMQEFGNTSCASIPLTLVCRRAEQLKSGKVKHIACGFGVGLSWGAVNFETESIVISELIEIS